MKQVTLKITGGSFGAETGDENIEMITEGKLYEKDNALFLEYDESEMSGLEGCSTTLVFKGDTVSMRRKGDVSSIEEIIFEKGKRFSSQYETPFGLFALEVLTNGIKKELNEEGYGKVDIDYHISLDGFIDGRNELKIEVMQ